MALSRKTRIHRVIDAGDFDADDLVSMNTLLEAAGQRLDKARAHEITGTVLFQTKDGKFWVGNVEFSVGPANGAYVKDCLKTKRRCAECGNIEDNSGGDGGVLRCSGCGGFSVPLTESRIDAMIWPKKTPSRKTSR